MPKRSLDSRLIYYVYILFDWLGTPRYIGKGREGTNREDRHERQLDNINWRKKEFIEQTWIMLGEIPKIIVRGQISEKDAFITETSLIKVIGRIDLGTGPLTNLTNGGDGASGAVRSQYTKLLLSISVSRTQLERYTPAELRDRAIRGSLARTHEQRSESALRGNAKLTPEERRNRSIRANASMTQEERTARAILRESKIPPEVRSKRARERAARKTPEERNEIARKRQNNKTSEQKSAEAKKGWITRRNKTPIPS